MPRIMIIHPEGNLNNNANLKGIVEILCENGYEVYIYSPRIDFLDQSAPCAGSKFILTDPTTLLNFVTAVLPMDVLKNPVSIGGYITSNIPRFDLVIGIDRGIIEASVIAKHYKVPYGLISYELLFTEETGPDYLIADFNASQDISFAVCQDRLRSFHLSRENGIPLDKIIDIPAAGRFANPGVRTSVLHDKFGLPEQTKIAIYIGSVMSPFAGIAELIAGSDQWPDDWVLVLHERYTQYPTEIVNRIDSKERKNVFFSQLRALPFKKLHELLHAADLGLSLYVPQFQINNIWLGNNIKYLGMASGKTAVYLQHGLPILINEVGELSDHTRRNNLGRVVRDLRDIPSLLSSLSREELFRCRDNSISFFEKVLALDPRIQPLLSCVYCLVNPSRIDPLATRKTEQTASFELSGTVAERGFQAQPVAESESREFEIAGAGLQDMRMAGWKEDGSHRSENRGQAHGIGAEILRGVDFGKTAEKIHQDALELIKSNRKRDAVDALERLVASCPDYGLAHYDLGVLYFDEGDKEKALRHYQKAASIEPHSSVLQKNLADFYYVILGQVEDALEHYAKALSSNHKDIDTLLMLGHISVSKQKFGEAKTFYNKVLELEPWNKDALEKMEALGRMGVTLDLKDQSAAGAANR